MNAISAKEKPIIEECLRATHHLLTHYWLDVCRVRDAKDNIVALALSFKIDCSNENPIVKTRLGFSRRYTDISETTVDISQSEFFFLKDL